MKIHSPLHEIIERAQLFLRQKIVMDESCAPSRIDQVRKVEAVQFLILCHVKDRRKIGEYPAAKSGPNTNLYPFITREA